MRGSFKLFSMFGIPVFLHWTFGLILLLSFYYGFSSGGGPFGFVIALGLFIVVFGCVLLHEFGHALTARRYGIKTQDIILTPIGGIARLERMPEKPFQEFLVAIAGPMVNVGIAIFLFLAGMLLYSGVSWEIFKALTLDRFAEIGHFFGSIWQWVSGQISWAEFDARLSDDRAMPSPRADEIQMESGFQPGIILTTMPVLIYINAVLVLFNLIPAFPMDGGRVFRSLLAMRIGRPRATRIAAIVGQAVAVIFMVYGLWTGQYMLALVGFFVFNSARSENLMVQTDVLLGKFTAKNIMRTTFSRLTKNDWMQTPVELLQRGGGERNFLVFDLDGKLCGTLDEDDVIEAMKKREITAPVETWMETEIEAVHPDESLRYLFHLIQQKGRGIVPVVQDGEILGVVDEAGLRYFLSLQGNLARR